jgi:hypothetical protein
MTPYLDRYLIIFGGAGKFIRNIQRRETFNDLQAFDIYQREWINLNEKKLKTITQFKFDKKQDFRDIGPPFRRMLHVAGIYGGCYIVHGGIYGEDNRILEDFAMYDFTMGMWGIFKQSKKNKEKCIIGPRFCHTMTSVVDYAIDIKKRNSRIMWC